MGPGQQIQPIGASFGIALSRSTLQLPPLHSRSLSESLGSTQRPAWAWAARTARS